MNQVDCEDFHANMQASKHVNIVNMSASACWQYHLAQQSTVSQSC